MGLTCLICDRSTPYNKKFQIPVPLAGGQHFKLDEKTRQDISRLFDDGLRAKEVYVRAGKKAGVSYQTILRMRNVWKAEKEQEETRAIVRRLQSKTAGILLRTESAPSMSQENRRPWRSLPALHPF